MTNIPYPRTPNEYGYDVYDSVISQYANSSSILGLLKRFSDCLDPAADFDLFYNKVWNIQTAKGYGLDLWGRILGVTRVVSLPASGYFGFAEALNIGFVNGFWSGTIITDNFSLSDSAYRNLLLAKAASNITDGSTKSINALLMSLFPGRGNCYVREILDPAAYFVFGEAPSSPGFGTLPFFSGRGKGTMQIVFFFDFHLKPYELAIIQKSGVIPKPTGVSFSITSP